MTPFQKKLYRFSPYFALLFFIIYVPGLAPVVFGESAYYFSNFMLNTGILIAVSVISFVCSYKNDFRWYFPLVVAITFIPTIYIFYGGDSGYYMNLLIYTVFSLIFTLMGGAWYRKNEFRKINPNDLKNKKK